MRLLKIIIVIINSGETLEMFFNIDGRHMEITHNIRSGLLQLGHMYKV